MKYFLLFLSLSVKAETLKSYIGENSRVERFIVSNPEPSHCFYVKGEEPWCIKNMLKKLLELEKRIERLEGLREGE